MSYTYDNSNITTAALATLAWSESDEQGDYWDSTELVFSADAFNTMHKHVTAFMTQATPLLDELAARGYDQDDLCIGHDFTLTSNEHGAGFWDRSHNPEHKPLLDELSNLCRVQFHVFKLNGELYIETH